MTTVPLGRRDRHFIAACLLVIAVGGAIGWAGFARAFPEASIDFRVTREDAVRVGAAALKARGFDLAGFRPLVVFDHDDEAKVFLERTLGLAKASPLFGKTVPVWRWSIRWVRPLDKTEYRAYVSPGGDLIAFRRVLPEKEPAPDPGDDAARRLAGEALSSARGLAVDALRFIDLTTEKRPARVDRTFVWESETIRFGDAALRYLVELQGDRVSRSSVYLEVPERWRKEYDLLRSKNEAAGAVATFGLILTFGAMLVVLFDRIRRRDVKWRWAAGFGITGAALQLLSSLNELPLALHDYVTSESWGGFVAKQVLVGVGGAIALGLVLVLFVGSGEPLYREAYREKPALGLILSRQGLRSKRFFRGLLLGYALVAAFVAYQVVFYLAAERLGAWAPAEVPYSNLLGTRFPWLAVLLMGFMPATTEEFSSRMFSIPFFQRFMPRWAAVVVPAFIWGFAHAAYPNQPFFIRGVEVGLAGVAVGIVLLKADLFPLLVWHFTIDALYTSLLLLRSSNGYFVVSGALAAGSLLLPLVASIALYLRHGGFIPDEPLSNGAVGSAPAPVAVVSAEPTGFRVPAPLDVRRVAALGLLALVLLATSRFLLPRPAVPEGPAFRIDRSAARRLADDFVRRSGDDPALYLAVPRTGTVLPALEDASDTGADLVPYGWSDAAERWLVTHGGIPLLSRWAGPILPGAVWQVRYLRPLEKRSWWVVLDGASGRVLGFKRTVPEEEPGASLDDAAAHAHVETAVRGLGLDPSRLTLVSSKAETRKARRDHRLVLESAADAVGEARRRVVVELAGEKPVLVATALKLPEEWVRARERSTPATYVALAWKIAGIGSLAGLLVMELVKLVRHREVPWRRLLGPAALLTVPAALKNVAGLPLVLSAYPEGVPVSLGIFSVSISIALLVGLLGSFAFAFLVLAFVHAVRPDAWGAFRRGATSGPRALLAAALTLLLLVAIRAFGGSLSAAWPLESGVGLLRVPEGIETLLPLADVLASVTRRLLLLAGVASLGALALRDFLRPLASRIVTPILLVGLFVPAGARTAADVLVGPLGSLLAATALIAALAVLLRDDPRAYLFAAAFLGAGRAAVELVTSGVTPWVWNGVALLVGLGALVVWRGLDRSGESAD